MLKIKVINYKTGLRFAVIGMLCAGLIMGIFAPFAQAAGLELDKKVTKRQTSPSTTITSPSFTTAVGNELFLAFIAVDGPSGNGTQTISSVTGGGLTWTLRKRANAPGSGTSEIWQAVATTPKSNITVKATLSKGAYVGQMTVATFTGANLTQNGTTVGASASKGAAAITLKTTQRNSWVWGVGNDWDRAIARTVGPNQTKVDETVNTSVGDTQWVQRQNNITPAAGTSITLNTLAPTNDRWNLVAIEIPSANADTTPPSAPIIASPLNNTSSSNATPTFTGIGEVGATVNLTIDTKSPVTTVVDGAGNWMYTLSSPLSDGSHSARATQTDAAGNSSPASSVVSFTIDATSPKVTVNQKAGQADPTSVNSAAFTVVFSESVNTSTFESGDVSITGTMGTISSFLQQNETTWEVILTGMKSGDTAAVSINANKVSDLLGNGNQASTSTDNKVTYDEAIVAAPTITAPTNDQRLGNPSPTVIGTGIEGMTVALSIDGSNIACLEGDAKVTGSKWLCTPIAPLVDGEHILTAVQADARGHISAPSNAVRVAIDTARPTVTVNKKAGQADPTTVNSASFTIVFSEELESGSLAKDDFAVTGTSGTLTSLTQLTVTTWEATISTMANGDEAVLSLDAGKAADLAGNATQASTSSDNSVKYTAPATLTGWQLDEAKTGLAPHGLACGSLEKYEGPAKVPAGTTISEKRITKSLVLAQGGVTIERSCFMPTESDQTMVQTFDNDFCDNDTGCLPPAGLSVIRDSEFNGSLLDPNPKDTYNRAHVTAFKGVATLQRNYIHDIGSGIGIIASGTQLDALVEQNYVTGLKSWGDGATNGTHSDAFTIRDFDGTKKTDRQAIVRNNRFNVDGGNESGALFIQAMANINNVMVEGNLMEGFNYQLQLGVWYWAAPGTHYSNMKAVNNRFSGTGYGASWVKDGPGWSVWRDNFYNDKNAVNNQGRAASQ